MAFYWHWQWPSELGNGTRFEWCRQEKSKYERDKDFFEEDRGGHLFDNYSDGARVVKERERFFEEEESLEENLDFSNPLFKSKDFFGLDIDDPLINEIVDLQASYYEFLEKFLNLE